VWSDTAKYSGDLVIEEKVSDLNNSGTKFWRL